MSSPCQATLTRVSGTALSVLVLLILPVGASAQQACSFEEGSERLNITSDPRGGGSITRLTRPHFLCEGGVEIWSDSTVVYQVDRLALLYGSVRYVDGQRELRTARGRYFYEAGRFEAEGDVVVTNYEDGSRVENGDLLYLRQTESREVEEMTFTTGRDGVRPHATVYPERAPARADSAAAADSAETDVDSRGATADNGAAAADTTTAAADSVGAGPDGVVADADTSVVEPREPEAYEVTGDRLYFRGDSYFDAAGDVEIVRDSLFAFSSAAEYDGTVGTLLLTGSARVLGSGYELVGRTIDLASRDDGSDEIRARRDAVLTGDDLHVTAPQIVLHLLDGELERMVAVPLPTERDSSGVATVGSDDSAVEAPPRPFAVSQDMELTADSLDMRAPGGELDRIFAAGSARSVSRARSDLNVEELPELARHDWMEGDTIEVLLEPVTGAPVEATDAEGQYEVDRIIARVAARSLYRLTPSDSTAVPGVDPPALSYIVANRITIFMIDGQADRVESVGQVTGWHLEPLSRRAEAPEGATPGDSIAAPDALIGAPPEPPAVPNDDRGGDGAAPDAYFSPGL